MFNPNKEYKMSKKHEVKFSYDDDDAVNVRFLKANKMVVLSDEAVENYVREGVNYMINNPDEPTWYVHCANTVVLITREDEDSNDFSIVVSTPRLHGHIWER